MRESVAKPSWFDEAPCKGLTHLFFAFGKSKETDKATAICKTCPYIEPCAELGKTEPFGVWGGKIAKHRDIINPSGYLADKDWRRCQHCSGFFYGNDKRLYCTYGYPASCHETAARLRQAARREELLEDNGPN